MSILQTSRKRKRIASGDNGKIPIPGKKKYKRNTLQNHVIDKISEDNKMEL